MSEDRQNSPAVRLARIRAHLLVATAASDLMRKGPTGQDRDRGTTEYVARIDAIFAELTALEQGGYLAALEVEAARMTPGAVE